MKQISCWVCRKRVTVSNLARHIRIHAYCVVCHRWINSKNHVHGVESLQTDTTDLLKQIRLSNGLKVCDHTFRKRRKAFRVAPKSDCCCQLKNQQGNVLNLLLF